jgi:hypothetical protein
MRNNFDMTGIISISNKRDDMWSLNNLAYYWFIEEVCTPLAKDAEEKEVMESAVLVQGVSLYDLREKNPALAKRIAIILRSSADDLAKSKNWPDGTRIDDVVLRELSTLMTKFLT